jgi:hypothetical protein
MRNNNETLKFCCERFKSYFSNGEIINQGQVVSETFPSLRITKLEQTKSNENTNLMRFVIICSSLKENREPTYIFISNCPFCGCDLNKFYTNDKYINLDSKLLFL